jgi:hypothetical protein
LAPTCSQSNIPCPHRGHQRKDIIVQIRVGYEISYDTPQPTPMLLMLNVHPSRMGDMLEHDLIMACRTRSI